MQLTQATVRLETAVEAQLRLADPDIAALGADLLEVLRPAIKQTLMEVVEMAAAEVSGQLPTSRVEVRIVDGEPELRVAIDESAVPPPPPPPEPGEPVDAEARITLRLPGYLKELIADAAEESGDSVNTYVVDALRTNTQSKQPQNRVRTTLDL